MTETIVPRVVVSKCLGFAQCRYNGVSIPDAFVDSIREHVTFLPVCPECEIGLGVPRDPIRVVESKGQRQLVQPTNDQDVSGEMRAFAERFLNGLSGVDGFVLKGRSPSCGIQDVKIYARPDGTSPSGKGPGFFGEAVTTRFGGLAVEDEGRLKDYRIREHFLTKLYTRARFRAMRAHPNMAKLVAFQSRNKLLLTAYNESARRRMGRIVSNQEGLSLHEVVAHYERELDHALARPARFTAHINVLMHAMGYFSEHLRSEEKRFFLDSLERYRNERVPLSVPLNVVRAWIARFDEPYLAQQTYFEPYPEALMTVTDSGKGRLR